MKIFYFYATLLLVAPFAQAQRAPDPALTQKMRELACREQAAHDMQKPVQLPIEVDARPSASALPSSPLIRETHLEAAHHRRLRKYP